MTGIVPQIIDDISCYAPAFLKESSHFPKENFKDLYGCEQGHFWFEARNQLIFYCMQKYLSVSLRPKILEVGCGTGFVLEGLAQKFPGYDLSGTELYLEGLRFAKLRSPHLTFFQADARDLPFSDTYDAIGAFDVVEHIEEDVDTLKSFYKALKPGGLLFLSVPQHMWLWSQQDEMSCHKRRYTRKELKNKLRACGFVLRDTTSFVSLLLPLMALSRLKRKTRADLEEIKISGFLNAFLMAIMKVEMLIIKCGISLPMGGSLFCVAEKR